MERFVWMASLFWVAGLFYPARGGTIITTNLPAYTAIINISGTQDGAGAFNGDQSLWYEPFSTGGLAQLLTYTVQPGTYTFRLVDPADAARLFPALTRSQTNSIFTAWTFNSPWVTDYLVFNSAAATNHALPQIFDGSPDPTYFSTAAGAYNDAVAREYYDKIRPGPLGRDGTNFITTYTFATAQTLIFVVPDYDLGDNAGGISVLVSPAANPMRLTIGAGPGSVTLQWPTNTAGFALAQTTNLQPAAWSALTNVPVVIGPNNSITLPRDATTNRFFRLQNP